MPKTPDVAIFDFDGTLTRTDTIKFLVFSLLVFKPYKAPELIQLIYRYLRKKLSIQELKVQVIGTLIKQSSLKGVNKSLCIYQWLVNKFLRKDIWQRLYYHIERGDLVIIASASPDFAVTSVLKRWAISQVFIIGTEYVINNGKYTEELNSEVCFGEEKAKRIKAFLSENNLRSVKWAYSDDYSDAPILKMASNVIWVNHNN